VEPEVYPERGRRVTERATRRCDETAVARRV
jgi:hypothetical protein